MVSVVKFSEFSNGDLSDLSNTVVGVSGAQNAKYSKVTEWTTAARPITPFDGLIGYNTDLDEWEFYRESELRWVQFLTSSSGENWVVVTDASVNAVINTGYITNRPATPVNLLLPADMNEGDSIPIMGKGSGGWTLTANAGQTIIFGDQQTSVGGSISSTLQNDTIEVRGLTDDTTWTVWSAFGNLSFV